MRFSTLVPRVTPEQAFAAIGDFGKLTDWEPAVREVRIVEGDPLAVGTVYELVGSAIGGGLRLRYRIESIDPPSSITYVGGTENVTTTDTLSFGAQADGTVVSIASVMEFRGPTRWYGWLVRAGVYLGGRLVSLPALKRHLGGMAG